MKPATKDEALRLMREGWQLGCSGGIDPRAWLQQNGIGRGGPSRDVHMASFSALLRTKRIVLDKRQFPTSTYRLADQPRAANPTDAVQEGS